MSRPIPSELMERAIESCMRVFGRTGSPIEARDELCRVIDEGMTESEPTKSVSAPESGSEEKRK